MEESWATITATLSARLQVFSSASLATSQAITLPGIWLRKSWVN
jgi:hypothetical protein